MKIAIESITPIHAGDWHDPYFKWAVLGPCEERQLFYTKKDATLYKRLRKASATANEATSKYIKSEGI